MLSWQWDIWRDWGWSDSEPVISSVISMFPGDWRLTCTSAWNIYHRMKRWTCVEAEPDWGSLQVFAEARKVFLSRGTKWNAIEMPARCSLYWARRLASGGKTVAQQPRLLHCFLVSSTASLMSAAHSSALKRGQRHREAEWSLPVSHSSQLTCRCEQN